MHRVAQGLRRVLRGSPISRKPFYGQNRHMQTASSVEDTNTCNSDILYSIASGHLQRALHEGDDYLAGAVCAIVQVVVLRHGAMPAARVIYSNMYRV